MKATPNYILLIALAVAFSSLTAFGAEKSRSCKQTSSPRISGKTSCQTAKVTKVYVTGSRIPREVKLSNYPSGTDLTLTMIDRKQMDSMAAANVGELLKKVPMAQ